MSLRVPRYCPRCRSNVLWGRAEVYGRRVRACQRCGAPTRPSAPKGRPRTLKPLSAKRAAAKAAGDLEQDQWQTIILFYGGRCSFCETAPWAEQDHLIPIAKGGAHTAGNVAPACHACNQKKGRQTWYPRRRHPFMPLEEANV